MKKKDIIILIVLILFIMVLKFSSACDYHDCNDIDSVGITEEKKIISSFFEEFISYAKAKNGYAELYIENETFSDKLEIKVGETKIFHESEITLAKIDYDGDVWFIHGGKPTCFEYCFPECGDNICGFNEDKRDYLAYCPEDCMDEYCNDGICEDFDRRNCREDCADEFCGDGNCENFELNSCPEDCDQDLFEQYNLGKGYITQNKEYKLDNEYSVVYIDSNFGDNEYQKNEDLLATFKIIKNSRTIKEFNLNGLEVKRPVDNVPYLFKYIWNEPKERALIEIYGIIEFGDNDEIIKITENKGFFCDENFYYLTKNEITDLNTNREFDEITLNIIYGDNKGYNLHLKNEDIDDINSDFKSDSSSRYDAFHCNGILPYIAQVDIEQGYMMISLQSQEDQCQEDSDCEDGHDSTRDFCSGSPKKCSNIKIEECITGDNYCPPNCRYEEDKDCPDPDQCSEDLDCDDKNACTEDLCEGEPRECVNKVIKEGCDFEGNCINLGTRKSDEYCSEDGSFKKQKENDKECIHDFECISNTCKEGLCSKTHVIQNFINWILALFK
ncbi:MAG: hypothetical protein PHV16_02445 [Candidatus Nanoarchaeia archaeon]|nr:hypothetical protein [Candidatus Nanoarchaeia archaeon]